MDSKKIARSIVVVVVALTATTAAAEVCVTPTAYQTVTPHPTATRLETHTPQPTITPVPPGSLLPGWYTDIVTYTYVLSDLNDTAYTFVTSASLTISDTIWVPVRLTKAFFGLSTWTSALIVTVFGLFLYKFTLSGSVAMARGTLSLQARIIIIATTLSAGLGSLAPYIIATVLILGLLVYACNRVV